MSTWAISVTGPDGVVAPVYLFPSVNNILQEDSDDKWGIPVPGPRLPTSEPSTRDKKKTMAELVEEDRVRMWEQVYANEREIADTAYEHLPPGLSHLNTHHSGLAVWQCRACLKTCDSSTELGLHTGVFGIARCSFIRNVLAEIKEQQKKEYEEESEENFDAGDEVENEEKDDEDDDEDGEDK